MPQNAQNQPITVHTHFTKWRKLFIESEHWQKITHRYLWTKVLSTSTVDTTVGAGSEDTTEHGKQRKNSCFVLQRIRQSQQLNVASADDTLKVQYGHCNSNLLRQWNVLFNCRMAILIASQKLFSITINSFVSDRRSLVKQTQWVTTYCITGDRLAHCVPCTLQLYNFIITLWMS